MPRLKTTTFNVEWMVNLFKPNKAEFWPNESKSTGFGRKPKDVPMVCRRLAGVIKKIDPHILGIEEGPPRKNQLELFVKDFLNGEYEVFSMPDGRQSNHALVKKNLPLNVSQLGESHPIYKNLSRKVEYYTWGEVRQQRMENFTRKPVVLNLEFGNRNVELMVFHSKSKISKLRSRKDWISRNKEKIVDALRSRQKLSAEMAAVRRYLTHAILSKRADGCILLGDLNDGPNRDIFEQQFLIHNIVDELRGGFHREEALMHHGLPQNALVGKNAYTAKFRDPTNQGKITKVLLDHILISGSILNGSAPLRIISSQSKIEHDIYNAHVTRGGRESHHRPSDHIPVTSVFNIV